MTKMTIEQFRQTKKVMTDLSVATSDESHVGVPGLLYCSVLCIETRTEKWKGSPAADFEYMLLIGRENYCSNDLAELEQTLFEFADSEGYLDQASVAQLPISPDRATAEKAFAEMTEASRTAMPSAKKKPMTLLERAALLTLPEWDRIIEMLDYDYDCNGNELSLSAFKKLKGEI